MNKKKWNEHIRDLLSLFKQEFPIKEHHLNEDRNELSSKQVQMFEEMISFEMLLYLSYKKVLKKDKGETITIQDISAILSGHYEILERVERKAIYFLRTVFSRMKSSSSLNNAAARYNNLRENKDLFCNQYEKLAFQVDDKGEYLFQKNRVREKLQEEVIAKFNEIYIDNELLIPKVEDKRKTYDGDKYEGYQLYFKLKDNERLIPFGFKNTEYNYITKKAIESKYITEQMKRRDTFDVGIKPTDKQKKEAFSIEVNMENSSYQQAIRQMMEREQEDGFPESKRRDWYSEAEKITVCDDAGKRAYLDYTKTTSILGAMAQGKSTFVEIEMERLLRVVGGAKVGILTKDTEETIDEYIKYRLKGYKVTIIVGKEKERAYLKTRIKQIQKDRGLLKYDKYREVVMELAGLLGGTCQIHQFSLEKELTENEKLPCTDLILQKGAGNKKEIEKNVICPLFRSCGVFNRQLALKESEIWIGTSQAVVKSYAPLLIDSERRNYYELMKEYCDIILADESDYIQNVYDDQTIEQEEILYNDGGDLFWEMKQEYYDIRSKTGQVIRGNKKTYRLLEMINSGEQVLNYLVSEINEKPSLYKEKFHNHTFKSSYLLREFLTCFERLNGIEHDLIDDWIKIAKFKNQITDKAKLRNFHEQLFKKIVESIDSEKVDMTYYNKIAKKIIEAINKWFKEYEIEIDEMWIKQIKKSKEEKEIVLKIKDCILSYFFSYVSMFLIEHYYFNSEIELEYLTTKYAVFNDKKSDKRRRKLQKIAMETKSTLDNTAVDFFLTYEWDKKNNEILALDIVQNKGIGRSMLFDYDLLNGKENGESATIVFLSATSKLKHSTHFNINTGQEFLLIKKEENDVNIPKIKQFVTKEEQIVSGSDSSIESMKQLNIKYKQKMIEELQHWKDTGVKKSILITVNSYEQAYNVAKHLAELLGEEYLIGYLKDKNSRQHYANLIEIDGKEQLKQLSSYGVDIVVVPLMSMNRGYNIITKSEGKIYSYFGTIFFYIRPLLNIQLQEAIKVINGFASDYINETKEKGLINGEAWSYIKKMAREDREYLVESRDTWMSILKTSDERFIKSAALYTFINCYQMIGRLYRGYKPDLHIYWVDSKFRYNSGKPEETKNKTNPWLNKGMLEIWLECLEDEKERNPLYFEHLYGPFYYSLKKEFQKDEVTISPFL